MSCVGQGFTRRPRTPETGGGEQLTNTLLQVLCRGTLEVTCRPPASAPPPWNSRNRTRGSEDWTAGTRSAPQSHSAPRRHARRPRRAAHVVSRTRGRLCGASQGRLEDRARAGRVGRGGEGQPTMRGGGGEAEPGEIAASTAARGSWATTRGAPRPRPRSETASRSSSDPPLPRGA